MTFSVVIPARHASTRLPGKPLLDIGGKPMLRRVWERAGASAADEVVIATDDERIRAAAEGFGARALMTSDRHRSGTERVQEAAAALRWPDGRVVVNVQADEPMIPPAAIDRVADDLLRRPDAGMATLCHPDDPARDAEDPHAVKVVLDNRGRALYFSRAPIPYGAGRRLRHVGIYAYRVETLRRLARQPPAELERRENLEQLRALCNGIVIHVGVLDGPLPPGVDTERDLAEARARAAAE